MKFVGLTKAQVAASRKKYGANIIPGVKRKTAWQFLLDVFRDKINLIGAAVRGFGVDAVAAQRIRES
ncbi:MAG: hypothetical protein J6W41_04190, partial [Alphaproteobacteria bacterium]|nr:hypothetical protein [Alphaproteobacteria bacterium]